MTLLFMVAIIIMVINTAQPVNSFSCLYSYHHMTDDVLLTKDEIDSFLVNCLANYELATPRYPPTTTQDSFNQTNNTTATKARKERQEPNQRDRMVCKKQMCNKQEGAANLCAITATWLAKKGTQWKIDFGCANRKQADKLRINEYKVKSNWIAYTCDGEMCNKQPSTAADLRKHIAQVEKEAEETKFTIPLIALIVFFAATLLAAAAFVVVEYRKMTKEAKRAREANKVAAELAQKMKSWEPKSEQDGKNSADAEATTADEEKKKSQEKGEEDQQQEDGDEEEDDQSADESEDSKQDNAEEDSDQDQQDSEKDEQDKQDSEPDKNKTAEAD